MTTIEVEHEDRVQSDDEQVEEHDDTSNVKEPVHEDVVKEEVLNKPVLTYYGHYHPLRGFRGSFNIVSANNIMCKQSKKGLQ